MIATLFGPAAAGQFALVWRVGSIPSGLVASAVAVLGPARFGAREPDTLAERLAGEALVRGRGAMVSAAGTLLALAIVLQGGTLLLRAGPPRARAPSRAVAYALWALCAFIMRRWLDQAR